MRMRSGEKQRRYVDSRSAKSRLPGALAATGQGYRSLDGTGDCQSSLLLFLWRDRVVLLTPSWSPVFFCVFPDGVRRFEPLDGDGCSKKRKSIHRVWPDTSLDDDGRQSRSFALFSIESTVRTSRRENGRQSRSSLYPVHVSTRPSVECAT